ncbi:MAG: hypothetical protein ACT4O9_13935 [Blastocatellia bacterium]
MKRIMHWNPNMTATAFFLSMLMTMLLSGVVSGQQKQDTVSVPERDTFIAI